MKFFLKIYRKIKYLIKVFKGDEIHINPQLMVNRIELGSEYGSWVICPDKISQQSVIYSFGIGKDISFDLEIINKFDCKLFAFDPTPQSIVWLKNQNLPINFNYYEFGIADKDGSISFYHPDNQNFVSHTIIENEYSHGSITVEMLRLSSVMKKLNHSKIDILKLDIEGAEYDVVNDILKSELDINQILIEFHHRFSSIPLKRTKKTIDLLNANNFQIFNISSSRAEYSFIKTK